MKEPMPDFYSIDQKKKTFEYKCVCCNEFQRGTPAYGYDMPIFYFDVPEDEREARIYLDADTCAIDNKLFFVKGILDIPIHGASEPLTWGVWVSQSVEEFHLYRETMGTDRIGQISFGWLAITMPGYNDLDERGNTVQLKCDVKGQAAGQRPVIQVQECDHPLYRDQYDGISWDRAVELVQLMPH